MVFKDWFREWITLIQVGCMDYLNLQMQQSTLLVLSIQRQPLLDYSLARHRR